MIHVFEIQRLALKSRTSSAHERFSGAPANVSQSKILHKPSVLEFGKYKRPAMDGRQLAFIRLRKRSRQNYILGATAHYALSPLFWLAFIPLGFFALWGACRVHRSFFIRLLPNISRPL